VALLASSALTHAQEERWWDNNWKARRVVRTRAVHLRYPQFRTAWVMIPTYGLAKPDGSDIRVVIRGKVVPFKVMSVGPGDVAKVAFDMVNGFGAYEIYFGNPNATPMADWEPTSGLLLTVRKYTGGGIGNLAEMRNTLTHSGPVLGADFVPNVFLGYDPYGDSENFTSYWLGWLDCQESGSYIFTTSSDDASFLLIDGKLVTSAPGWHGAVADTRWSGTISLTSGRHKFEYLHCQGGGGAIMVAAWKPPSFKKVVPIAQEYFTEVSRAELLRFSILGESLTADFVYDNVGQAFYGRAEENTALLVHFRNMGPASNVEWDFGDGLTGANNTTAHVYLEPGTYRVTLKTFYGGRQAEATLNVSVEPVPQRTFFLKYDDPAQYYDTLRKYDLAAMTPASLASLYEFFATLGKFEDAFAAGRELVINRTGVPDDLLRTVATTMSIDLIATRKTYETALSVLDEAIKKTKDPDARVSLMVTLGEALYDKGDVAAATKVFQRGVFDHPNVSGAVRRRILIDLGECFRETGRPELATKYLAEAAALLVDFQPLEHIVRRGSLPFVIENDIQLGNVERAKTDLEAFIWEFPLERMQSYTSLFKARIYILEKKYTEALRTLNVAYANDPNGQHASEVLYRRAEVKSLMGRKSAAAIDLRKLIEEFPESPFVKKARSGVEGLERSRPSGAAPPSQ